MTLVEFKVQCLEIFCCHGNKSTILLFNSIFRIAPEVSTKLYFVEISLVSEKLCLFNHKRANFLDSKFWNFFHLSAYLSKTIVSLSNSRNFYAPLNFDKAIWLLYIDQ